MPSNKDSNLAPLCDFIITTDILKSERGNQGTEETDGMVKRASFSQSFCLALLALKIEGGGLVPRHRQPLDPGEGKETNPTLELPLGNVAHIKP